MKLVYSFIVLLSHTQSLYTKLHNPKEFVKIAFINCHLDSFLRPHNYTIIYIYICMLYDEIVKLHQNRMIAVKVLNFTSLSNC